MNSNDIDQIKEIVIIKLMGMIRCREVSTSTPNRDIIKAFDKDYREILIKQFSV